MDNCQVQPHIRIKTGEVDPVVLTVGDAARGLFIAKSCSKYEELANNREYHSYRCYEGGVRFTVISHGIGSAGCAICFEELIKAGAKIIIRAGTAGSLQPKKIKTGDSLICVAAAREDGVSKLYVPSGFPALADPYVLDVLRDEAKNLSFKMKLGITLTCDIFYVSPAVPSLLQTYADSNIDIVEMEMATLFTIAQVRGIKAAGVCCIDGSPLHWCDGEYDPKGERMQAAIQRMTTLVIACAVRLTKEGSW